MAWSMAGLPGPGRPTPQQTQDGRRRLPASRPAACLYATRADVMRAADDIAQRRDLDPAWVRQAMGQARYLPHRHALGAAAPVGFAKNWRVYRSRFIDPVRIGRRAFWQANADTLERAEREYGVPAEIIVGIIGVETIYGQHMGNFRVIDALATLAFDFPAAHPRAAERAQFFRGELEQFPVAASAPGHRPLSLRGSYAGAMGCRSSCPPAGSSTRSTFDGDGGRPVRQPGRRDRLGGQLLQGLWLAARHAHALPGAFDRPAGPGRPAGARHPAHLQRGQHGRPRAPCWTGGRCSTPGRWRWWSCKTAMRPQLRGRHRELLRHHPLQLEQLLRHGGDRTGAGQFTKRRAEHDGATAHGAQRVITRNGKQHIGLHERRQIQGVAACGRIERVLVGVQIGNEGDDFGLVWGFKGDGHERFPDGRRCVVSSTQSTDLAMLSRRLRSSSCQ
jgi:hypothetical protein